jgi:tetratricopeptide (TPR) repeat protein
MSWPVVADGRQGGDRTIAKLLMPYFDEYTPEKSNAVRTRFPGASGESIEEADDLQGLLNRAEKATNQTERDLLYANAVMNATRRRDLDRASQILERISNERTRSQVSLALNRAKEEERYQKAQAVLRSGDFEAAYKLIDELPDRNRHLWMLCDLAGSLFSKNDTTRALLILGEAEQQIKSGQDNVDKARNTLQLVGVAGRMDPKRGFENLKAAVDTINHLDLAPQWQRFETVGDAKNGIMARTNVGLEVLFAFFDNSVSRIANVDFDRALQLAQGIQMREASVLAQLVICRAVLVDPSAR